MKKEDKDIFIDSTVKSVSQEILYDSDGQIVVDAVESKPVEIFSLKPVIKSDMINIQGVTIHPKEIKEKKTMTISTYEQDDDPMKNIHLSKEIPTLFIVEERVKKKYTKIYNDFNSFHNGFINIYTIKLVKMPKLIKKSIPVELNTKRSETSNSVKVADEDEEFELGPVQKNILLFGPVLNKCERYDEQGNKLGKDKLLLDYIKISIEENDFNIHEYKMKNIEQFIDPVQNITLYFHKIHVFFKKMKENVLYILKNINLKSFFLYLFFQELDGEVMLANTNDVTSAIDKLTFEECFLNIYKFASFVETRVVNSLLNDEEINEFDINLVKGIDILGDFTIMKDFECIKNFLIDFLFMEYSTDRVKKFFVNEDLRNNIQLIFFMKLTYKMKNYFLNTYYFCCFEKSLLDNELLIKKKLDKNFFICFFCNSIVCEKCLKYHLNHTEELLKFDSFDPDNITEELASKQKNKFREKIDNTFRKKIDYKRKYILLVDYVKILTTDFLIKKLLPYRTEEDFNRFKQQALNNKEFIDLFILHYNKNSDIPMLNTILSFGDEDNLPCFKRIQNTYYHPLTKVGSKEKKLFNRKIIEDISVGIISGGKPSLKFISRSNLYNEFNTNNMNVYLAHRYSPKAVYRDIFIKNKSENKFLDKYIFPWVDKEKLFNDDTLEDENQDIRLNLFLNKRLTSNANDKSRASINSRKNFLKEPSVILEDKIKIFTEDMNITTNNHLTTNNGIINDDNKTKKEIKKKMQGYKSNKKVDEHELNLLRNILNINPNPNVITKNETSSMLKILIAFIEDIIEKLENYGVYTTDQDLKPLTKIS